MMITFFDNILDATFTQVRVGIEKEAGLSPESKMVVLHDFTPCVDDELEVKRGQVSHHHHIHQHNHHHHNHIHHHSHHLSS